MKEPAQSDACTPPSTHLLDVWDESNLIFAAIIGCATNWLDKKTKTIKTVFFTITKIFKAM
jgi:hypothetical protein